MLGIYRILGLSGGAIAWSVLFAYRRGCFGDGKPIHLTKQTLCNHEYNFLIASRVIVWQDRAPNYDLDGNIIPLAPFVEWRIKPFKFIDRRDLNGPQELRLEKEQQKIEFNRHKYPL